MSQYEKGKTNLDFTEARDSVAVASAGPYASLHLAPDRQPCQHPTSQFLQAGCPSCRPTNSVKALKAQQSSPIIYKKVLLGPCRNTDNKKARQKLHTTHTTATATTTTN